MTGRMPNPDEPTRGSRQPRYDCVRGQPSISTAAMHVQTGGHDAAHPLNKHRRNSRPRGQQRWRKRSAHRPKSVKGAGPESAAGATSKRTVAGSIPAGGAQRSRSEDVFVSAYCRSPLNISVQRRRPPLEVRPAVRSTVVAASHSPRRPACTRRRAARTCSRRAIDPNGATSHGRCVLRGACPAVP